MCPDRGELELATSPIRFALTEAAVVELMDAITATTARRIASELDAPYAALERRWHEIGGMLELAPAGSRLTAWCAPWRPTRTPCAARWRRSEAGHNGRRAALRSALAAFLP
jgi:hypothetical protein